MKKPNIIWQPFPGSQTKFLSCPVWECLYTGSRGNGKKIPNYSKVLCKSGYKRIDELILGELVYSSDGNLYPVTGIFPQGISRIYNVVFQDKRISKTGDEHLWLVRDRQQKMSVVSTIQMYPKIKTGKPGKYEYKYKVPNCKPIQYPEVQLPLDPYMLGCLISEGSLTLKTPRLATSNQFILDYFKKKLPEFEIKKQEDGNVNHTIVDKNKTGDYFPSVPKRDYAYSRNRLNEVIEFLGLNVTCKFKFIPDMYKTASVQQRLDLLCGLMDTDGCITTGGHAEFTSSSKVLINDVKNLCRSLGIRCQLSYDKRIGRKHEIKGVSCTYKNKIYRLFINTKQIIAKDPKKIQRCLKKPETISQKYISIVDIEKTEEFTDMTCISVDSPDNTFIIDDFVVTHNTDCLVMDYLQDVGKGYGADYRGLILREATTELEDVIAKTKKWIPLIFPTAKFNNTKKVWTFKDGETLRLSYARTLSDYFNFHGWEISFCGFEELTSWAFPELYLKLMSINRCSNPKVPKKYRATCNSSGPGFGWVKERFINSGKPGEVITDEQGMERTYVMGMLDENKALLEADPQYKAKLESMTKDDDLLYKSWVLGSWDLIMGGFFTDVWRPKIHVLKHFTIPKSWHLYRSFDWGSSKPWAVTYIAESNGEQPKGDNLPYIPRGSCIIVNEIYGWNGKVNQGDMATSQEISERVLQVDRNMLIEYGIKCMPGPADTSIWDVRDGSSIANNLASHGCHWTRAYKGSGSRIAGWSLIRQMLGAAKRQDLESPHLYFFEQAKHHIRTLPMMQRDQKKPEDLATEGEDHCFAYDTEIITSKGIEKIGDLVGTTGKVLTLNNFYTDFYSCRLIKKQVKMLKVTFTDYSSYNCTPDHKFFTTKGLIEIQYLDKNTEFIESVLKIKKIEPCEELQDSYCLEAKDTHVFALSNGVIVANCMDSMRYGLARKMTRIKRKKVRI